MSLPRPRNLLRSHLIRSFASAVDVHTKSPLSGLSAAAREKAEQLSTDWKGTSASGGVTKNYIGGQFVESKSEKWLEVADPVCSRIISS